MSQAKQISEPEPREQSVRRAFVEDEYGSKLSSARSYKRPQTWPSNHQQVGPQLVAALPKNVSFYDKLYAHCRALDPDAALDLILDEFHPLVMSRDHQRCDELLMRLELDKVDAPVALGFLSAVFQLRHQIEGYERFFEAARERIRQLRGEAADRIVAPFR